MLSTKVLASSPLAKILTDDMTDELMHELSTMTEIALLWNPCSDIFLMDTAFENWTNTVQFCPTLDKCSTILGFWYYNYRADVSDRPPIWEVISK